MAYSNVAGQFVQVLLAENLYHQTGSLVQVHLPVGIGRYYSAPLLTAVLQAVKSIIGILCGVLHAVNAKHSAFVM
jgi:hypothetical protein